MLRKLSALPASVMTAPLATDGNTAFHSKMSTAFHSRMSNALHQSDPLLHLSQQAASPARAVAITNVAGASVLCWPSRCCRCTSLCNKYVASIGAGLCLKQVQTAVLWQDACNHTKLQYREALSLPGPRINCQGSRQRRRFCTPAVQTKAGPGPACKLGRGLCSCSRHHHHKGRRAHGFASIATNAHISGPFPAQQSLRSGMAALGSGAAGAPGGPCPRGSGSP